VDTSQAPPLLPWFQSPKPCNKRHMVLCSLSLIASGWVGVGRSSEFPPRPLTNRLCEATRYLQPERRGHGNIAPLQLQDTSLQRSPSYQLMADSRIIFSLFENFLVLSAL
jgi:hypothetical protein